MSDKLDRREFFRKSVFASAVLGSGLSFEEKALLAADGKPDKAASQGKIDGIVGIVGALEAQMRDNSGGSVYEQHGLTVFG